MSRHEGIHFFALLIRLSYWHVVYLSNLKGTVEKLRKKRKEKKDLNVKRQCN